MKTKRKTRDEILTMIEVIDIKIMDGIESGEITTKAQIKELSNKKLAIIEEDDRLREEEENNDFPLPAFIIVCLSVAILLIIIFIKI